MSADTGEFEAISGRLDAIESKIPRMRGEIAALGRTLEAIARAQAIIRGEAPPKPPRHLRSVE